MQRTTRTRLSSGILPSDSRFADLGFADLRIADFD